MIYFHYFFSGYSRLGNSFLQLNKIAEAVFAFEKAAELEPSNSETQSSLSLARLKLNGKYARRYARSCVSCFVVYLFIHLFVYLFYLFVHH